MKRIAILFPQFWIGCGILCALVALFWLWTLHPFLAVRWAVFSACAFGSAIVLHKFHKVFETEEVE